MPRRVLSLWFPRLASDRLLRRRMPGSGPGSGGGSGAYSEAAFAVTLRQSNMERIHCLNHAAAALGLAPGMSASDARALVPGLQSAPADLAAEARFLRLLCRWAGRYSPWVGLEGRDGLVLDVTGAAHLFGGEAMMLADMAARMARAGISLRSGLADTRGAAWALARYGSGGGGGSDGNGGGGGNNDGGGNGSGGGGREQHSGNQRAEDNTAPAPGPVAGRGDRVAGGVSGGGSGSGGAGGSSGRGSGRGGGSGREQHSRNHAGKDSAIRAPGPVLAGGDREAGGVSGTASAPAAARDMRGTAGRLIAEPGQTLASIGALPVAALRLEEADNSSLQRLGISSIAALAAVPRATLTRRFGPGVLLRLDQALGALSEQVSPLKEPPRYAVRLSLPEPIGLSRDVMAGVERLLQQLCARLEKHGQGVRVLQLTLRRVDQASQQVELRLARAMRDAARILPLFQKGVDTIEAGYGIDQLRLEAVLVEAQKLRQLSHVVGHVVGPGIAHGGAHGGSNPAGLEDLMTRLGSRIGLEQISRYLPADSHIPERSFVVAAAAWSPAAGK
jgi:nucleotidyltransferase/DNA polymerase involved in DNA repair